MLTVKTDGEVAEVPGQDLEYLRNCIEAGVEPNPNKAEPIYPCIKKCKNTGVIVLFSHYRVGTVIASKNPVDTPPGNKQGGPYQYIGNNFWYWNEPEYGFDFEPYFGPVTLQYTEDAKV